MWTAYSPPFQGGPGLLAKAHSLRWCRAARPLHSLTHLTPFSLSPLFFHSPKAHYPERLGLAVVCNPPTVFWMFWRALQPFLDPVTKAKVDFATSEAEVRDAIRPHMVSDVLYASLGGDKPDETFDGPGHAAFMVAMEGRRREKVAAAAAVLKAEE